MLSDHIGHIGEIAKRASILWFSLIYHSILHLRFQYSQYSNWVIFLAKAIFIPRDRHNRAFLTRPRRRRNAKMRSFGRWIRRVNVVAARSCIRICVLWYCTEDSLPSIYNVAHAESSTNAVFKFWVQRGSFPSFRIKAVNSFATEKWSPFGREIICLWRRSTMCSTGFISWLQRQNIYILSVNRNSPRFFDSLNRDFFHTLD